MIKSKSLDNGVICGSRNNLVVDASLREALIAALKTHGAAVLTPDEIGRFTTHVFDPETGHLRREVIGQSAQSVIQRAGIRRAGRIRLIVVPLERDKVQGPYGCEKLAPILPLFTANDEADGFTLCRRILANGGSGHTGTPTDVNPWARPRGFQARGSLRLRSTPHTNRSVWVRAAFCS